MRFKALVFGVRDFSQHGMPRRYIYKAAGFPIVRCLFTG